MTEQSVRFHERWLLDKATHQGYRYVAGRELSDFELLARLQHHGAATRLLDTTRNALVGLFFACSSHYGENGLLFGIHSDSLGGGEGKLLSGNYDTIISEIAKFDHPQTWEPPSVSARVAAQRSQFVYSAIKTSLDHGSIALGTEITECLLVIEVNKKQKTKWLELLMRAFDISPLTLFPDIDGFSLRHGVSLVAFSDERW